MHATWGKATTTAGGAGALTLVAVTGFPTPAQVVGVGPLFSYAILSAAGQPLEAGIGYLSDSSTMVRARVMQTWDGSTLTRAGATAVNVPSGAQILLTPQASTLEAMAPSVDSTSGVGRIVTSAHRNLSTTNAAVVALRAYYMPFQLRCGGTVAQMACQVTTAGAAGSLAQMGIYGMSTSGGVGALLSGAYTAQFDVASAGMKIVSLNTQQSLPPGWYYAALAYSGSGLQAVLHSSAATNQQGGCPLGMNGQTFTGIDYRYEALASLALPAAAGTTSASSIGTVYGPMLGLVMQ